MSNIISQISRLERELLALKSGFAGNEKQWFGSTVTTETFVITTSTPLTITVDFQYRDFPLMFTSVYFTSEYPDFAFAPYVTQRQSLYTWRVFLEDTPAESFTIDCLLVSEQAPTVFTIEAD